MCLKELKIALERNKQNVSFQITCVIDLKATRIQYIL